MIEILSVAGARPNFIKIAALQRAFDAHTDIRARIVHTGQHYDAQMSDVFFRQLELPEPDAFLNVGSGSHAEQTAGVMTAIERELIAQRPNLVIVVGDVNSTMAAALTAAKLNIPVGHVEAGLRSFDRSMPEEVNRVVTDSVSDWLYVSEESGLENLRREGARDESVFFAGNVMIDSLVRFKDRAAELDMAAEFDVERGRYVLATLHRPSNVDDPENLDKVVASLNRLRRICPVIFPVHPRTRKRMEEHGGLDSTPGLVLSAPLGYLEFLNLMMHAGALLTDSGGVQEEATFLQVPCLTVRENTERPATIEMGTNELLPLDPDQIETAVRRAVRGEWKEGAIPPRWDGHAADRIAEHIAAHAAA